MTGPNNIANTSSPEKQDRSLKVSIYKLLADLYFFFNALLLPKGLLYTTILSPYFFYRQLVNRRCTWWREFLAVLLCFDCIHLYTGVNMFSFIKSNLYFILTYFSVISFYHFFNNYKKLPGLFKHLILLNFLLALIAIPFFFMEPYYQDWFWWVNREALSKHEFPRLKLFTYEASYYSLLMVPVVYYYVFKFLFRQIDNFRYQTLFIVLLPVFMSMSFGVIGASGLTAILLAWTFRDRLLNYRRPLLITMGFLLAIVISLIVLFFFFPHSAIALRIMSIVQGTDTSANGRTSDSFGIAWNLIERNNIWFGIGLGQIKIQIDFLVKEYYSYWGNYARYDIPNAMGETLAIFGIFGVIGRIALQLFLFVKTKVKTNYYRLALFIFVFIYQFTGSFITNIAEYVIWILAFSKVFDQFNVKSKQL